MLKNKTIIELKDLCSAFEIEYSKNARKQDIIEAINEAKITWEMYEESSKSLFDYKEEPKVSHKDAEEKEFKPVEIKESKPETRILLKLISGRAAYLVRGYLFTNDEPFVFVPEEIARKITLKSKDDIREATAEEVAKFYGVK